MMRFIRHDGDMPLWIDTGPIPTLSAHDVLIAVRAAGVNRPDLIQRAGLYPPPPGASPVLGLEVAGEIAAIGGAVERWRVGDRVAALAAGGGYAEYCAVDAGSVLPVPQGLDFIAAASLPETVFTVWTNVMERARLRPGERFLVHGGASGIGVAAIQMARAWGAEVYATAGTPEKCAFCETIGARRAIHYRSEDFSDILREAGGVDVILDMVGAPYLAGNIATLRPEGRMVSIAFLEGASAEINLMPIMLKRLTLTGSTLRIRSAEEKAAIAAAVEANVWPWLEDGRMRAIVDAVFPFANAEAAHRRLQSGEHIGKVVLSLA